MRSVKCPQCGLVNVEDAEACKRCRNSLDGVPREVRDIPNPKPGISALPLIVIALLVAMAGFWVWGRIVNKGTPVKPSPIVAATSSNEKASPAEELCEQCPTLRKRRQFALGLDSMLQKGILRNAVVTTEGPLETELVITADNAVEDDLTTIVSSDYREAMSLAGFDLLVLRDRDGHEWKRRIY